MTDPACHICRRPCAVGIVESVWFGRWFQHRFCGPCWAKEEKERQQ